MCVLRHIIWPFYPVTQTCVVVLRNMVSVDEIDEDLKDEVASECGKFGTVVNVVIHKQTQGEGIDAEEIVKIFVRFKSSSGNPL